MTNKSIVTALTLDFLAFTLLILPVTTANAECNVIEYVTKPYSCPKGWTESSREFRRKGGLTGQDRYDVTCCTTPSTPYATGETESERQERLAKEAREGKAACEAQRKLWEAGRCIDRPIKVIGKSKEGAPTPQSGALKAACIHQGWHYNEQTGRCINPSQAKADCEGKGPNRRYDPGTGACMKTISKAKEETSTREAEEQSSSEQTEEQSSSEHSSDDSYDDHHHKKKKKKRHHD